MLLSDILDKFSIPCQGRARKTLVSDYKGDVVSGLTRVIMPSLVNTPSALTTLHPPTPQTSHTDLYFSQTYSPHWEMANTKYILDVKEENNLPKHLWFAKKYKTYPNSELDTSKWTKIVPETNVIERVN